MALPSHEPVPEDLTDALVDGDRPFASGTAHAALRHRDFRVLWAGTFASNVGTWMQNVLLGAFAYTLTGSVTYVALLFWAQLGPLLVLAAVGGALADVMDRRRLVLWTQLGQLTFSIVLAGLAAVSRPSEAAIFLCVLAIGVGNALGAPALNSVLPTLVPRADLPGAVSLQSVQMNLSRVIGPVIGAILYTQVGASPVFLVNAGTYLFAVAAILAVEYPRRAADTGTVSLRERMLSGFRIAHRDTLIRRIMITLFTLSFFSLGFVGLMPLIAASNLDVRPRSVAYGVLYAVFGLGAALGAVSVGTWLAGVAKARIVRPALVGFAVVLAGFALVRSPGPAYVVAFVLGYAYFTVITSLSTVLQEHVADAVRGRVMALWIMGFGGTVPVGVLAGGVLAHATSVTVVLVTGAAVAAGLAVYADLAAVGAPE